jgi:hypothetical protein
LHFEGGLQLTGQAGEYKVKLRPPEAVKVSMPIENDEAPFTVRRVPKFNVTWLVSNTFWPGDSMAWDGRISSGYPDGEGDLKDLLKDTNQFAVRHSGQKWELVATSMREEDNCILFHVALSQPATPGDYQINFLPGRQPGSATFTGLETNLAVNRPPLVLTIKARNTAGQWRTIYDTSSPTNGAPSVYKNEQIQLQLDRAGDASLAVKYSSAPTFEIAVDGENEAQSKPFNPPSGSRAVSPSITLVEGTSQIAVTPHLDSAAFPAFRPITVVCRHPLPVIPLFGYSIDQGESLIYDSSKPDSIRKLKAGEPFYVQISHCVTSPPPSGITLTVSNSTKGKPEFTARDLEVKPTTNQIEKGGKFSFKFSCDDPSFCPVVEIECEPTLWQKYWWLIPAVAVVGIGLWLRKGLLRLLFGHQIKR